MQARANAIFHTLLKEALGILGSGVCHRISNSGPVNDFFFPKDHLTLYNTYFMVFEVGDLESGADWLLLLSPIFSARCLILCYPISVKMC